MHLATHTTPEADLFRAEHALINVARTIITYQTNVLMPSISKVMQNIAGDTSLS